MPSDLGKAPPKPRELQTLFILVLANPVLASAELQMGLLKGKRQRQSAERDDSSLLCNKELLSGRRDVLAGCSAALWNRLSSI